MSPKDMINKINELIQYHTTLLLKAKTQHRKID